MSYSWLVEQRDKEIADLQRQLEITIDERDTAEDALQSTHIKLGGDGEWSMKSPQEHAPNSGDLRRDTPALAKIVVAERDDAVSQLTAMREALQVSQDAIYDALVVVIIDSDCGRKLANAQRVNRDVIANYSTAASQWQREQDAKVLRDAADRLAGDSKDDD